MSKEKKYRLSERLLAMAIATTGAIYLIISLVNILSSPKERAVQDNIAVPPPMERADATQVSAAPPSDNPAPTEPTTIAQTIASPASVSRPKPKQEGIIQENGRDQIIVNQDTRGNDSPAIVNTGVGGNVNVDY